MKRFQYDAVLLVSFGGPEGPDEVMPFLENVLRGKNVPRERMLQVAEHYQHFGGVSPINQQNRELIVALEKEFAEHDIKLPIYWGNRNWNPMLADAMRRMGQDGVKRCLALVTSAFSCYSGCRQYRENIFLARREAGESAPEVVKMRVYYNHPGFIEAMVDRVAHGAAQLPAQQRERVQVLFTAHSIPEAMASGSNYVAQLQEASRLVSEGAGLPKWRLVFQSRSGPPTQPWLAPDICDALTELHQSDPADAVIVCPLGFVSDHMEVLFDLDTEAKDKARELGMTMIRSGTAGTHPAFIRGLRELVMEYAVGDERKAVGDHGPYAMVCPIGCCPSGRPGAESCVP